MDNLIQDEIIVSKIPNPAESLIIYHLHPKGKGNITFKFLINGEEKTKSSHSFEANSDDNSRATITIAKPIGYDISETTENVSIIEKIFIPIK